MASNGTFFSDSPDEASPGDAARGTFLDYRPDKPRQEAGKRTVPSVSRRPPSTEPPSADIAPWMDDGLTTLSTHGFSTSSFFNDGPPNLQLSPSFRPDTGGSDPPDTILRNEERRPSIATSATTESSQTSVSKASTNKGTPYKKVAGFFSDDGRQSSRNSDTSIPGMLQREQTASSSRHGSIHTSRDEGRPPTSPNSSRPRTPLPSSEVTPWLFQDFKVSPVACACLSCRAVLQLFRPTFAARPIGAVTDMSLNILREILGSQHFKRCRFYLLRFWRNELVANPPSFCTVVRSGFVFPSSNGALNYYPVISSQHQCFGSKDKQPQRSRILEVAQGC